MKKQLEDTTALTKEIAREYYRGNLQPLLSRLCEKSVWVGTGERTIIGGEAIRAHYLSQARRRVFRIFQEDYYPLPIDSRSAMVVSHITIGNPKNEAAHMAVSCTLVFQLVGGETKIVLAHVSYGFLRAFRPEQDSALTWVPAYHLYRNLLLDLPETNRIAIPSGGRTFYIDPNVVLYVRSVERRAVLYCVDAVVRSDLTITKIKALLPESFLSIHRCYVVNPRYVSVIQRYKVTMVTGETLPVPLEAYNRVKAELNQRILGTPVPRKEP